MMNLKLQSLAELQRQHALIEGEIQRRKAQKQARAWARSHIRALHEWVANGAGRRITSRRLGAGIFEFNLIETKEIAADLPVGPYQHTVTWTFVRSGQTSREARAFLHAAIHAHLNPVTVPPKRAASPRGLPILPVPSVGPTLTVTARRGFPDQFLTEHGFVLRSNGDDTYSCLGKEFGGERVLPLTPVEVQELGLMGITYRSPEADLRI